jgi:hypothetical protein
MNKTIQFKATTIHSEKNTEDGYYMVGLNYLKEILGDTFEDNYV